MKPKDSQKSTVRSRQQQPQKTWLWTIIIFGVCSWAGAQPPTPTGLTVLPPYDGQINLIWAPDSNATPTVSEYQIIRQLWDATLTPTPNPIGTPTPIATVPLQTIPSPGTPVYQDFQVTNGLNYFYQVSGVDSGGNVGAAATVNGSPYLGPVAVQPVAVQNIHSNALDLSWGVPNSSYPVSYYQVYLYQYPTYTPTPTGTLAQATNTPTPPFPVATVPASAALSNTPLAAVSGTTYSDTTSNSSGSPAFYYVVMAVDSQGHVSTPPASAAGPALPHNMASPGPPALSVLVGPAVSPTIIPSGYGARLVWTGSLTSEGVTVYQVFQNSTPIATIPYQPATPTVTYDDTTLPEGNGSLAVTYSVVAVNTYGVGTSNSVSVSLIAANESTNIQVTPNATSGAVTITWNPATPGIYGLVGYRLYKSLFGVPTFNQTPIPSISPTATLTPTPFAIVTFNPSATFTLTPYVDSPPPNLNHMNYWVEPVDATVHGGFTNSASTPALNLAPTPPSFPGVAPPVGNNQIAVSWTAGGAGFFGTPVDYVVYRVILGSPTPTVQAVATVGFTPTATQVSYTDIVPGATPGTEIDYQIGLVDVMGNTSDLSTLGNQVFSTGVTVPAAPTVLPMAGSAASIRFCWLNNPLADSVTSYSVFGPDLPTITPIATPLAVVFVPPLSTPTLVFAPTPNPWAATFYYLSAQNSVGSSAPATLSGIPVPLYTVTAVIPPGTRQAQVSWTMVPAPVSTPFVDSYGIYRSLQPTACFTPIATVIIPGGSYTDVLPAATAGVSYYYRVTARADDLNGHLAESSLHPAMTPDPLGSIQAWPNPPSGFTALSGVTQTTLNWAENTPQEGVTSYTVYWYGTGTPTPIATVLATQGPSTVYSFVATETPGNQSSYDVVANNPSGPSDASQSITVLVPPSMTPNIALSPPTWFVPAATITPGVWISGFTYPGAVSGYSVYWLSIPTPGGTITPSPTPAYISVGSVVEGISTPVIEASQMAVGYVNNYQVVANNGGSVTAVSTISAPLTVALWPAAPNPTLLPSNNSVTVAWGTPVGNVTVTSYDIYRNIYPTMTPVMIASNLSSATTVYPDSPLTNGTAYLYWMDAQNASGGVSYFSAPQTIIPLQQAPTIAITPLPERNQICWLPISVPTTSPVTGFAVYRAIPTPGVVPNFVVLPGGTLVEPLSNTSYVDATVSDGVSYLYEVAPTSANGILGPFSNQAAVNVFPQPVTDLVAASGDTLVQLRWEYQGVANNTYFITRKLGTAPNSSAQTLRTGFQGLNFNDSGVVDKNFYIYNIYTVDANGLTSNTSAAVTALPAAGPALPLVSIQGSNGSITAAPVTLTQNTVSTQTAIGNSLSWGGADQASGPASFNSQTMYPLGGYEVSSSSDGGNVYQILATLPVTLVNGYPAPVVGYFDQVQLVSGSTYSYLVQAFDNPPDLPVPLSQAVTEGWVHVVPYQPVNAYPISPNTALDRNAIRPFGASNEQIVNIRFVVTSKGNVDIKVYTLDGTFVKELVNQSYSQPGIYWTKWDARNRIGNLVASGVYLVTTESPGGHQEFEKVAVIK